jgi:hypothetical protein
MINDRPCCANCPHRRDSLCNYHTRHHSEMFVVADEYRCANHPFIAAAVPQWETHIGDRMNGTSAGYAILWQQYLKDMLPLITLIDAGVVAMVAPRPEVAPEVGGDRVDEREEP